jgi:DeoR family transcriptional regulator, suf operon transcriptional repressor
MKAGFRSNKSRRSILAHIRRGPVTIADLIDATGLSVNAVRFHLDTLEMEGLVTPAGTLAPTGPGKPAALYTVTPEADLGFSRAYAPVLAACIAELRSSVPSKQVIPFLHRVGKRIGGRASVNGRSFAARVKSASDFLNAIGGVTTVVRTDDGFRIVGKGCPLAAVVKEEPCTCSAVEALVSQIIGKRSFEKCVRNGRPSCCFEVPA